MLSLFRYFIDNFPLYYRNPYLDSGSTLYIVVAILYSPFRLAMMLLFYKYFIHSDNFDCNKHEDKFSHYAICS